MLRRIVSVSMLAMAAIGFGIGFMFRGLPVLDALDETIAAWGIIAMMSLVWGALYVFGGRIDSTWRAGWDAERRVGDLIEHVIVETGCAFAHDVKEGLGGSGNRAYGPVRHSGGERDGPPPLSSNSSNATSGPPKAPSVLFHTWVRSRSARYALISPDCEGSTKRA